MNPKHNNPTQERHRGRAPYNFVPLPEAIALIEGELPPQDAFDKDLLLTGKLHCTLTTSTPLYVRAAQTWEEYEGSKTPTHPAYGETRLDLMIPGSSLRGMLRNLVEIVSYSRLAPVTNRRLFFRTVDSQISMGVAYHRRMKSKVRAGFFHQESHRSWIEPALLGRVDREKLKNKLGVRDLYKRERRDTGPTVVPEPHLQGRTIYVRLRLGALEKPNEIWKVEEDFSLEPGGGLVKATLVITGDMPQKKHEYVFVRLSDYRKQYTVDEDDQILAAFQHLEIDDELLDAFQDEDQLTQYQENAFPRDGGRLRNGWLKDGDPLFYLPDEEGKKVVFFGRAYMFRLPYQHSPREMISAELQPKTGWDLTEALFGTVDVGKGGRGAVAGRVFVCDAHLEGDGANALLEGGPVVLSDQALSSPKPTAVQHYLTQRYPNPVKEKTPSGERLRYELFHYDHHPEKALEEHDPNALSTLRGHKLYWHHSGKVDRDSVRNEATQQVSNPQKVNAFHPVKEGQVFSFDIYFENLRPFELGALLWVLDKADDEHYRLKLGMGKPYGLGSVKIEKQASLSDRAARYSKLFAGAAWNEGLMKEAPTQGKLEGARQAFCDWLLDNPQINPNHTLQTIEELPRIQELLALLRWPGPKRERTRYMNLDDFRGKEGTGFDKRAILPTPICAAEGRLAESAPIPPPRPKEPSDKQDQEAVAYKEAHQEGDFGKTMQMWEQFDAGQQAQDTTTPAPEPQRLPPAELPSQGMRLHGVVDAVFEDNGIYLRVQEVSTDLADVRLSDEYSSKPFAEGDELDCIVEDVIWEDGVWVVICHLEE